MIDCNKLTLTFATKAFSKAAHLYFCMFCLCNRVYVSECNIFETGATLSFIMHAGYNPCVAIMRIPLDDSTAILGILIQDETATHTIFLPAYNKDGRGTTIWSYSTDIQLWLMYVVCSFLLYCVTSEIVQAVCWYAGVGLYLLMVLTFVMVGTWTFVVTAISWVIASI